MTKCDVCDQPVRSPIGWENDDRKLVRACGRCFREAWGLPPKETLF